MKLITYFLAFSLCIYCVSGIEIGNSPDDIQIEVFEGSNSHWLAVAIRNDGGHTKAVQVQDASLSWQDFIYITSWGYWTCAAQQSEFVFPLSFQLVSDNGDNILAAKVITSLNGATQFVDTGVTQYHSYLSDGSSAADNSASPNLSGVPAPAANEETYVADEETHVADEETHVADEETHVADEETHVADEETHAADEEAPAADENGEQHLVIAEGPMEAPALSESESGDSDSSNDIYPRDAPCLNTPMKLLVPLFSKPDKSWGTVAKYGRSVPTVAIISVRGGPGDDLVDSDYDNYMSMLASKHVDMIGYVRTSYGTRPLAEVKADIDRWALNFPLISGIFFDGASADLARFDYYESLYNYVINMPGYKYAVLNTGAIPDQKYYDISTQIVTLNHLRSSVSTLSSPSSIDLSNVIPNYGSCENKDHFAAMIRSNSAADMRSVISRLNLSKSLGWIYVSDNSKSVSSYYEDEAAYLANTINV